MNQTITVMPILIEPEKLSKQELLEKCKDQQQTMILQGQTLHEVCCKLHDMNKMALHLESILGALVDSFDANDRPAIALQLRQMSDRRKSYKKPEVH